MLPVVRNASLCHAPLWMMAWWAVHGDHGGGVVDVYKCNEAAQDARAEETFQRVEGTMAAYMSVSSEKRATLTAPLLPRNVSQTDFLWRRSFQKKISLQILVLADFLWEFGMKVQIPMFNRFLSSHTNGVHWFSCHWKTLPWCFTEV